MAPAGPALVAAGRFRLRPPGNALYFEGLSILWIKITKLYDENIIYNLFSMAIIGNIMEFFIPTSSTYI